jgi:branched-chain amino acid transport system ATP-binding protein
MAAEAMLVARGLGKVFGGFKAVTGVDFELLEGERHAIIGPNGAGKTTFFNLLTGHLEPTTGEVTYKGQRISGLPPHKIVKLGLARSFQRINIYPRMTVFQNVQVALIARHGKQFSFFTPADGLYTEQTGELLELVDLGSEASETAGELAYGKQKQLELAISLAADPDVLLLDEPTAGMSPSETADSIKLINDITKARGLTLLFTEHDMGVVFGIADRITVLHHGEIIASGLPEDVRNDPEVRTVYLGEEDDDAAA